MVLSCLVAPYGGWIFDLTVLILPVLFVLTRRRNASETAGPLFTFLGVALISWFGFRIEGLAEPLWFTPAVAVVLGYGWYKLGGGESGRWRVDRKEGEKQPSENSP